MIDLLLLAIVGVVAWCVAAEGAWGATQILFSVIFAGLLAMNFFEPAAVLLEQIVPLGPSWRDRWDFIALMGLFGILVTLLRLGTEQLMPNFIEVHPLAFDAVRWGAAAMTGYVSMAIVLTALHTAPLPRTFLGFEPERDNFLGMAAPDRQWLGFVQYVSEHAFRNGPKGPVFDGSTTRLASGQEVLLPSFAIRYGSRREMHGQGGAAPEEELDAAPVVVPTAPSTGPGGVNL